MRLKLVDTTPGIAESKFGGRGYVPHDAAIPTNSEGVQMRLLAQIDCRQITIPDFPTSGLLQFWAINDDLTWAVISTTTPNKKIFGFAIMKPLIRLSPKKRLRERGQ